MRILHVIHTLSPETGGPPVVMRQFAIAFAAAGHDVEVACLDRPSESFLSDFPCTLHAIGPCYLGSYAYSRKFQDWLRKNAVRFDLLVMHGIWNFPALAVRQEAIRAGKPYGVFVHGALDPWFDQQYPLKRLKKSMYWPLLYPVLRDARAVFFTAQSEAELAKTTRRPNAWNSVVVPLGISDPGVSEETASKQRAIFYDKYPELQRRRFLLFLARIHTKKGCDLLIDAFARVAQSAPELDLVMAGPDQERMQASLQLRAEKLGIHDRLHWPGMINGELKWGALRACDALILPSHQENFGIGIVEALAVGRPVLISNKVNIWSEIESDRAGVVDEDTVEGTGRLLRQWLALSAEERAAMGIRARKSFLHRFTMNQTVTTVTDALSSSALTTSSELKGVPETSQADSY